MFARQVFRPARTLQSHIRRYAAEPAKPSGGSNALLYAGVAAAAGAGIWYWQSYGAKPATKAGSLKPSNEVKKTFTGGDQGFVPLVLDEVQDYNHNTKIFRFKLPDEDAVSGLSVASALITKHKSPEMEKPVIRPYTPINEEDAQGYLELLIKRYPKGPMSEHIHSMTPGQTLDFKGPIPKYQWSANKHEHVVMIAGGTGITPMYQLTRKIFGNPEDRTKVTLVFGNISEDDILLKKELADLETTYPQRFRAFYLLDKTPKGWSGGKGFVTKELLKTVMPEPKEGDKVKVFVCGPPGMYKSTCGMKKSPSDQGELEGFLKELGYSKDQVFKF